MRAAGVFNSKDYATYRVMKSSYSVQKELVKLINHSVVYLILKLKAINMPLIIKFHVHGQTLF